MPKGSVTQPPAAVRVRDIRPNLDCGATALKRCVGDEVVVSALVFTHGTKTVRADLLYRQQGRRRWLRAPMSSVADETDRFEGRFTVSDLGAWEFAIEAWTDPFASWQSELRRRIAAGQRDLSVELAEGSDLLGDRLESAEDALAVTDEIRADARIFVAPTLVAVDPPLARFGAWYELFPRSFGGISGVEAAVPEIAALGFDVLYLTPIHPIGVTNRKGANNTLKARKKDPGSPWAIGAKAGGHTAIHPELGTFEDFDKLIATARNYGVEIALDLAYQASPDHPWLTEHPEWFRWRADGTVKFAENPPKRYEDIVNFDFDCADPHALWVALVDVVRFWIERGVRVFRVDNPHTKPFAFWHYLLDAIRQTDPDVIFLAEAFTRPVVMHELAKLGFHQSYTYFTWRNSKREIIEYVEELAGQTNEFFRPNFFANTPDILHEYLQHGGPPAFNARLVLAATLSPSYGIYSGFENYEREPREAGSEEYLDSEKYQIQPRGFDGPLLPHIRRLNEIRRDHPVFQRIDNVRFLESEHDQLLVYAKGTGADTVIVCVNLDPRSHAEGLAVVPPDLGLPDGFAVEDLLAGQRYWWSTGRNYLLLPPGGAHVMAVR